MANIPGTNVPGVTFGATGFLIPQASAVLAGVQADINAAFGTSLNFNLNTPQGQLSSSIAAITFNTFSTFQFFTQQVDPAYATGRMQDAIGRIYFMSRIGAQPTTIQVVCSGLGGVIPPGALVQDAALNLYAATVGGTIPNSGSVTLAFACTVPGPVPVPVGALTIYQAITGWDTATVSSGTLGNNTETRAAFEARRQATVAANSVAPVSAIKANVLNVPGVTDCYVIDNPTAAPVTTLGVTVAAHSVYVAAQGGTDLAVATAIWQKKAPGCGYTGNTTVAVQDSQSGYLPPFPSYNVTFQRPTRNTYIVEVDLVLTPQVPSNAASLVQNAILAASVAAGTPTFLQIGGLILASSFLSTVFALGSWVQVRQIAVGSSNTPAAQFTASITGTVMTVTAVSSGTLAANQFIFAAGIATGTVITSQAGGTPGGIGTYNLNISQTVGSESMLSAAANLQSLQVPAAVAPALLSPGNILVTVT